MKTETVQVVPYDPNWPSEFEAVRRELSQALGPLALSIEHVGSTSVPGLCAKPILDIDVVMENYDVFPQVLDALAKIGYRHEGNLGIPEREAFCYTGKDHLRKHHLYVCPASSPELHRHLTFRDYLRTHPQDAAQYGRVKKTAAKLYPRDIDSYLRYKSACIRQIYTRCGL